MTCRNHMRFEWCYVTDMYFRGAGDEEVESLRIEDGCLVRAGICKVRIRDAPDVYV